MSNKNKNVPETPENAGTAIEVSEPQVLATVPVNALSGLLDSAPQAFIDKYRNRVAQVGTELPTYEQIVQMVEALPAKYSEPLGDVLQRTMGSRDGLYTDDAINAFPELRLFQGTGNDPNRPDTTIPGQFYLTTKESVGKVFEGTPLAVWTGSTMWPPKESEGARVPVCHSMNRTVGSTFGECAKCPNKPWRNGQQTLCGNDVVAFFLSKDLRDIVLVRFAKTSEPAGKQLISFSTRSKKPYSRWYSITATAKTHSKDASRRWFLFNVSPQEGEDSMVPEELWPFLNAAMLSVESTFILPAMVQIYRQAELAMQEPDDTAGASGDTTPSGDASIGTWGGTPNV